MSDNFDLYNNTKDPSSRLDIAPIGGKIGAEVRGVTLSGNLSAETTADIRAALLRHKVIFFRDQHISDADHEDFTALLGAPVAHPTVPVASGSRYLLELDSKEGIAASSWHTDVTFVDAYPKISVLRSLVAPEAGGDTLWANAATAYEALPEPLKLLVDNLWAVHSNQYDYADVLSRSNKAYVEQHKSVFTSTVYETEHPVVHVHPETGERSLILGHFLKNFVGLNSADSARLFNTLQDHATKPEHTVRWRWRAGDIAIWDNRATQHRAIADFGLQRRTLRRATVAGEVPVSIDGRTSRTTRKDVQQPAPAAVA